MKYKGIQASRFYMLCEDANDQKGSWLLTSVSFNVSAFLHLSCLIKILVSSESPCSPKSMMMMMVLLSLDQCGGASSLCSVELVKKTTCAGV